MEKIEKMCVRCVHRLAARQNGAVGSAKRLARAEPATTMFRFSAVAEQNTNGIGVPLRRRLISGGCSRRRTAPKRPTFPENRKRTGMPTVAFAKAGQKVRLELCSYRTHIFSIFEERSGKQVF